MTRLRVRPYPGDGTRVPGLVTSFHTRSEWSPLIDGDLQVGARSIYEYWEESSLAIAIVRRRPGERRGS